MTETFVPDEEDPESDLSSDEEDFTPDERDCEKHPFHIAASTFWIVFNLSVDAYKAFVQFIPLAGVSIPRLPKSLVTLHKWVDDFLPPTVMRETSITVATRGLPAGGPKALNPTEKLVYCEPIEFAKAILQNPKRREMMYFGAQLLVERVTELYESFAWGSSILAVSGDFAYYPEDPTVTA